MQNGSFQMVIFYKTLYYSVFISKEYMEEHFFMSKFINVDPILDALYTAA